MKMAFIWEEAFPIRSGWPNSQRFATSVFHRGWRLANMRSISPSQVVRFLQEYMSIPPPVVHWSRSPHHTTPLPKPCTRRGRLASGGSCPPAVPPAAGGGAGGAPFLAGSIAARTGHLLTLNGSRFPPVPTDGCSSKVHQLR